MRFSLIVATLGRSTELQTLFDSLAAQTYRNFDVTVIDQNSDDRLVPVLESYKGRMAIRHLRCAPGLSRARNIGLQDIGGDAVCFPDDDCWYPVDLLANLNRLFREHPDWQGVVADSVDQDGQPTLPWRDRRGRLSLAMSWRRSISYAIFLRTDVIKTVGGFNETLGLGSGCPWGSGEDNDIVLRALKAGFRIQYEPELRVLHPRLYPASDAHGRRKRYHYALGDGKLLQRHPMPAWWHLLFFSIPAGRALFTVVRLNVREAHAHWLTLLGRIKGFVSPRHPSDARIPFPLRDASSALLERRGPGSPGYGL